MADDTLDEHNLGLLLFIPYRFMESAVIAELKAHGHDLGINQARVFARIDPGGSRLSELAEASQLSKQTVGSIVDQLQAGGYVRRDPDPLDARARRVTITDRGRRLIDLSRPVVQRIEADWEAHLGPTRTRQLREALSALCEITDPFAARDRGDSAPPGARLNARQPRRGAGSPS